MVRREAQIWKNQENLTNLGLITENLELGDQLKVKLALRSMRKAYINGGADSKRFDVILQNQTKKYHHHLFVLRSRRMSTASTDSDGKRILPYSEKTPLSIQSIGEIQKKAKHNNNVIRDKIKLDKETRKLGMPKVISPLSSHHYTVADFYSIFSALVHKSDHWNKISRENRTRDQNRATREILCVH